MAFIELRGVTKTYRKGGQVVTPLADVSLDVAQGEFFVLLGPSGSGKTTLLNLLAAVDRADSGTVTVGGRELGARRGDLSAWRSENVGYVFQQANLVPVLTAYENVELPLGLFKMSRAERHRRTALALEAVGLGDRADHLPKQLSGGQEQRVAIARAVVADPPLLVADEPTGNLDHASADGVLLLLKRLNEERGKTVVMVTHDSRAAAFGSRRMLLDKGELKPAEPPPAPATAEWAR
jgi:putative ABC transport system ATP-binding protein